MFRWWRRSARGCSRREFDPATSSCGTARITNCQSRICINRGGGAVRCFGTDRVGYEEEQLSLGRVKTQLSKIVTQCDVMINVPILKHHKSRA